MKSAQERGEPDGRHIHSFIVKVWLEEVSYCRRWTTWRGQITHVPSNRRQYISNLADVALFIAPYLTTLGMRFPTWHYVALRLLKRCWARQGRR